MDIKATLKKMSLEDKVEMLMGTSAWYTKENTALGIPSIRMSDGPYGLRKVNKDGKTEEATCFPPLCTLANSFDSSLAFEMGVALGEECQQNNVNILLGPAVNIKRGPLGGRNFEYLSEDPYVAGKLAGEYINGLQSQGVGCSLKHYCVNNQENYRFSSESGVDERALNEIYLTPFRMAIASSSPLTMMVSYNRFNGHRVTESQELQIQKARNELNFSGLLISDWGANHNRVNSLLAGLDLEMPGDNKHSKETLLEAYKAGKLDMGVIDRSCARILSLIDTLKSKEVKNYKYSKADHNILANKIASSGAVLLKNNGSCLPLRKDENVCLIGEMGQDMRFEGEGSSKVIPTHVTQPLDALKSFGIFPFEKGYYLNETKINKKLEANALKLAERADKVVIFAGYPRVKEGEGYDKKDIKLPLNQIHLITELTNIGKPIVLVLFGGGPMELPFINGTSSILAMYLPGQTGGQACAQLLFGEANPSGRLSETWPLRLEDTPNYHCFLGRPDLVEYRESIYVGYRYYDKSKTPVLFPFGYGLSYSKFTYSKLEVVEKDANVEVSFTLKNIGPYAGAEVSQLYIGHEDTGVFKAQKELKRFVKTFLNKDEEKRLSFILTPSDFAYYNVTQRKFIVETGVYSIIIGPSSKEVLLSKPVKIKSEDNVSSPYDSGSLQDYFLVSSNEFSSDQYSLLMGKKYSDKRSKILPLTMDSLIGDFRYTFWGRFILRIINRAIKIMYKKANQKIDRQEMLLQLPSLSMNTACSISSNKFSYEKGQAVIAMANGKFFSGLFKLIFRK